MTRYDDQMPDVIDAEAWAASTWIDQQQALCDAADRGPWSYFDETYEVCTPEGGIVQMTWPNHITDNAAFIAAARTSLPKALAALRAVGTLVTKHDPTLPAGTIAKLDLAAILATLDEDGAE